MLTRIRVELDSDTIRRLAELAAEERRPTAEQAAVILQRAMARRAKRREPVREPAQR